MKERGQPFVKTAQQVKAIKCLNAVTNSLIYGGSRSGKTTAIIRNMILRGLKKPSRHLLVRHRYNHAKVSIMHDTMPKLTPMCFPGLKIKENKSDSYYEWDAQSGGKSQLWIGGIDDAERIEKILGNEYSTIFLNEISQISFEAVTTLQTRLAENTGLKLRMYMDCNPPGKRHWSYKYFHEGLNPDGTAHGLDTQYCVLNPMDNIENLPPEYVRILEALPERQRQRYLSGMYLNDIEGAHWSDQDIINAKMRVTTDLVKVVVAIDPATTDNPGSDECGIMVCGLDDQDGGVILDDRSAKCSTRKWAQRAVNAYHDYNANEIVAESNQGGDLVKDAIHAIDPNIKITMVHAANSKRARAEPVAQLYELGRIAHDPPENKETALAKLEEEYTTWIPDEEPWSPNRLDAAVWGFHHLFKLGKDGGGSGRTRFGVV